MIEKNECLENIIKDLNNELANIHISGNRTDFLKKTGKRDGLILAIDTIRKYIQE